MRILLTEADKYRNPARIFRGLEYKRPHERLVPLPAYNQFGTTVDYTGHDRCNQVDTFLPSEFTYDRYQGTAIGV